ncbi:MAG: hypothetical protein HON53_25415 [Planctomycetaceae bacterium]|jgi:hypothetical protein|nr:hypothetical protein [Planctomycetaceae bacterium]MBT6158163.1 hypothetical protein [Planctomycetaceae bacterium]MBT6487673.1 hypothetical protein [Planctomycetaceae bacterium]MBT6495709.1 hypothetical protein [Planctomycetaceae bacterium]
MSNNKSLKSQLKEKDELVAALTERLELAAEQLDRFQRSGADQNVRGNGGGFDPQSIERQESLVDDLQQAVQQWNEMQAGVALGNLETQVSELHDLVSSNSSGLGQPTWQDSLIQTDDAQSEQPGGEVESGNNDEPAADQEERWASLKSHLMETDEEQLGTAAQRDTEETVGTDSASANSEQPATDPGETADPPEPIAEDEADVAVLQSAVSARDEYIGFLIRKLRHAKATTHLPTDWTEWEASPEELCRQVEELQSQLTETLRLSELEHSLERARLGREESRVRQMEETARKTLRQLGLDPDFDGDEEIELDRDSGTGNRWLKMLGICNDDDDVEDEE